MRSFQIIPMEEKRPPFIQFQNIMKSFGKNQVLQGVSLNIPYGERFGVIGVSGSGKSTLLNILIGFLRSDQGSVYYNMRDILREKKEVRKTFGFAAQDGSFYEELTVNENLIIIEINDIQPPDIPMDPILIKISLSKIGLKIPMKKAKGATKSNLLSKNVREILPTIATDIGNSEKINRPDTSYLPKDTTVNINIIVVINFTRGSKR